MFTGEYKHSFDSKGRVIIPAKMREELGDTFYIGKGLDKCINVYPVSSWNNFVEKLSKLSSFNKKERFFLRKFISGFSECSFDKQGRILIPSNLRDHCCLKEEASIIGVIEHIEIWDKDNWCEYCNSEEYDFESIAEEMSDLDLGL